MGALCALAALAALSVMASGLPEQFKPMFAVIAGLYGLAMARREALRRQVRLAASLSPRSGIHLPSMAA